MTSYRVFLYEEDTAPTLRVPELVAYLREKTGLTAAIRRSFPLHFLAQACPPSVEGAPDCPETMAERIANLKVRDVSRPFAPPGAVYGEIEFERRRLAAGDKGAFGVLYDGLLFQALLGELLPREEAGLGDLHLVFTNRTLGTWEQDDLRYHLRTVLLGQPAIISTSGLVEAPAKPRGFYVAQQAVGYAAREELTHALLKEEFRGRFLDHDDPRLTEVAKGFVMQAVAYQWLGEGFCPDRACRLFNAHWQEELLHSQLERPEFCERHEEMLARLRREIGCAGALGRAPLPG